MTVKELKEILNILPDNAKIMPGFADKFFVVVKDDHVAIDIDEEADATAIIRNIKGHYEQIRSK